MSQLRTMMLAIEPKYDRKRTIATLSGNSIELDSATSTEIKKYQTSHSQHIGFPSESLKLLYKQWHNMRTYVNCTYVPNLEEYSTQQNIPYTRNHLEIRTREIKLIKHLCKYMNIAITKITIILPPINNDCILKMLTTAHITDLVISVRKNFRTASLCNLIRKSLKQITILNDIGNNELNDITDAIRCSALTHFNFTIDIQTQQHVLSRINVPNLSIVIIGNTDMIISTETPLQSLSVRFRDRIDTLMNYVPLMRQTSDLKITFFEQPGTCVINDTFINSLSVLKSFASPVTLAKSAVTTPALISLLNNHQLVNIDVSWPRDAVSYPSVTLATWQGGAIINPDVINALRANYTLLSFNNGYVPTMITKILKRNALYTWQRIHAWLIEIAIIFAHLPPYVLIEIFDWSYMPAFPHVHGVKKVNLIIGINDSISLVLAYRSA